MAASSSFVMNSFTTVTPSNGGVVACVNEGREGLRTLDALQGSLQTRSGERAGSHDRRKSSSDERTSPHL